MTRSTEVRTGIHRVFIFRVTSLIWKITALIPYLYTYTMPLNEEGWRFEFYLLHMWTVITRTFQHPPVASWRPFGECPPRSPSPLSPWWEEVVLTSHPAKTHTDALQNTNTVACSLVVLGCDLFCWPLIDHTITQYLTQSHNTSLATLINYYQDHDKTNLSGELLLTES